MRISRLVVRWLHVRRFRNLAREAEARLEFTDDLNLVIGVNGAGKTTLLELLAAVIRTDFRPFEGEPFDLSFRLERAPYPEYGGMASDEAWPSVEVTVTNDVPRVVDPRVPRSNQWSWAVSYRSESVVASLGAAGLPSLTVALSASADSHVSERLPGLFDGSLLAALAAHFPASAIRPEEGGFDMLPEPQWSATRRLDEALGYFTALLGDVPSDATPTAVEGGDWAGWPRGTGMTTPTPFADPQGMLDVDYVNPGVEVQFAARLEGAVDGRRHYRGVSLRGRWNGESIASDSRIWSFGQKRLVALAWYLDRLTSHDRSQYDPAGVLLLDEVYNGLHHAWLEALMVELRVRRPQIFATAQSPLLLDYLEFGSPGDVARALVRCTVSAAGWSWSNPSGDEAAEVFAAYERGVLHVSEILRRDGIW